MYTTVIDGEDFAIKPMNCPGGMLVYKSQPHSYRDLPLRWASWALCTATSSPARCTACSASAASRRTTRISS